MAKLALLDRLACAFFGAVFGVLYGAFLALLVVAITRGEMSIAVVIATAAVFGLLGFAIGPFIGDVVAATFHFLIGLFTGGAAIGGVPGPVPQRSSLMNSLFWFGVGTAIAIVFAASYGKA